MQRKALLIMAAGAAISACSPTVKVQTDKPIEINLNVTVRQEVIVRLERDVQDLLQQNPGIF
jgi:hypothetical protein